MKQVIQLFSLWTFAAVTMAGPDAGGAEKKRWLSQTGYGLMFHYEAFRNHTPESYNKAVDSFDVVRFADSVKSTGAGNTGGNTAPRIVSTKSCWALKTECGPQGVISLWRSARSLRSVTSD